MWISKKKYEELVGRIDVIEKRISKFGPYGAERLDKCRDDIKDIQRVMEKSKLGEITYESIFNKTIPFFSFEECDKSKNYTLIYKDFKEYKIGSLYLFKPQFEIDEKDNNLIRVKDHIKRLDGTTERIEEYIVDLQNQTFIRTK